MKATLRERFGMWLERFHILHPWLLRYDGVAPTGLRFINRVNGHVVVKRATTRGPE